MHESGKAEIYYDGSCPLCRREINWYRRAGTEARFCDISDPGNVPSDLAHEDAMAVFHVRDEEGRLLSGAEAFVATWQATPRLRWLAGLCRSKTVIAVLDWGYRRFLTVRPWLQRRAGKAA